MKFDCVLSSKSIADYEKQLRDLYHTNRKVRQSLLKPDSTDCSGVSISFLQTCDIETPENIDERCIQLYHAGLLNGKCDKFDSLSVKIKHTCWLIENDAEHPMLSQAECYSFFSEDDCSAIEQAWSKRLRKNSTQFVLHHAALFFFKKNPLLSLDLILESIKLPLPQICIRKSFAVAHFQDSENSESLARIQAKEAMKSLMHLMSPGYP